MKEAVMKVMEGYVTAYKNNDKELFLSLWDEAAIFEAVSYTHLRAHETR